MTADTVDATGPQHIAAVMIHVTDVEQALAWYEGAFPLARRATVGDEAFVVLRMGDVQLEVVPGDEKVAPGPQGTVVYWRVPSVGAELRRLTAAGATLYRGPMPIEDGLVMCQVRDPWGNCLGLRGPS